MNARTPRKRSRRRRLFQLLILLPVRSAGWLAWVLILIALVLQGTQFGRHELEGMLARRLELQGSTISLGAVRFDWFGTGLTLTDLRVTKGDEERLYINRIYVSAHVSWDEGITLDRVDIDQGRLKISGQAIEDIRALINTGGGPGDAQGVRLPAVEVRGIAVGFETPDGESGLLGHIDLSMKSPGVGSARILGRIVLPRGADASLSPEVFMTGLLNPDGHLEMHTIVDGFELADWDMPQIQSLQALRELGPRGLVNLHTTGSVQLVGELKPRGALRLRLRDGSLSLPGTPQPIERVAVEIQGRFLPGPSQGFWDPGAWNCSGRLDARWAAQEVVAGVRFGAGARPGQTLEVWLQTPHLQVDTPALTAMEAPQLLPTLFNAVDPKGVANARFGLTLNDRKSPEEKAMDRIEYVIRVDNVTPMTAAYHGWPSDLRPEIQPLAFALPAKVDQTTVVFARTPRFSRPTLIDVRFAGSHSSGPMHGSYQSWPNPIDMPPFAQGYGLYESDLKIVVPRIALDDEVHRHLPGLWEIPALVTLYEDYGIKGGFAAVDLRICERMGLVFPAVEVDANIRDAGATFSELPVPVSRIRGGVHVLDGGLGKSSVAFDVTGVTESSRSLRLAGRIRSEADNPKDLSFGTRLESITVDAHQLDLLGPDVSRLNSTLPGVLESIAEFEPTGSVDLSFTRSYRVGEDVQSWAEITPLGAEFLVHPLAFPMRSEGVRGRVLLDIVSPPLRTASPENGEAPTGVGQPESQARTTTRIAPLIATWEGQVPVVFTARFGSDGSASGLLLGAGVRVGNEVLVESMLRAVNEDPAPVLAEYEDLTVSGAIDFNYRFLSPPDGGEAQHEFGVHLREIDLRSTTGIEIDDLGGELEIADGRVVSEEIKAKLGGTAFRFTEVELYEGNEKFVIEANVGQGRLAVNESLLRQFLDTQTAESLTNEFNMRGTLDIEAGHLVVNVPIDGPIEARVFGVATLSDAFLSLGLPVSVRSARVFLEELVVREGGDVRGWGRIEDLYGQAMGRDLAQTDLLVSYHGSQITIEQLDGTFCRGRIRGLGAGGDRSVSAPVISVDLRPPYQFQAGLQLTGVEVQVLLEDVFASGIADRGFVDAQVQLSGNLENLFDIQGSGRGEVTQTILWSVPVLRDLFSQLGLDETAIFDSMKADFRVAGGAIEMEGMRLHSPILQLRGSGIMGFDGTLNHDLEVRYSLVDKAGPFGEMIHWLQNRLLGISIRGDMSRPKVLLRGVFSNPFTSINDNWRALPSPGYTPLPARF